MQGYMRGGPGFGHCPESRRSSSRGKAKRKEKSERRRERIGKLLTLVERCEPVSKRTHRMKKGRGWVVRFGNGAAELGRPGVDECRPRFPGVDAKSPPVPRR